MGASNADLLSFMQNVFLFWLRSQSHLQTLYSHRLARMVCYHFPHLLMSSVRFLPSFSATIYNSLVSGLRYYSIYQFTVLFGGTTYLTTYSTVYRSTNAKRYACLLHRVARHLCTPSVGYHMNYWDVQYLIKPKVTQKTPNWTCIFYAHSIKQPQNVCFDRHRIETHATNTNVSETKTKSSAALHTHSTHDATPKTEPRHKNVS